MRLLMLFPFFLVPLIVVCTNWRGKVRPGQYASVAAGLQRRNHWPEYITRIARTYWHVDEAEDWESDEADDSPSTTTTTTTTTPEPSTDPPETTKSPHKGPISIHKHFHYFKKTKHPKTTEMPPAEMTTPETSTEMEIPDDVVMEMIMKDMLNPPGILERLSRVDPWTLLVAGIIPASLILAAALPSILQQVSPMFPITTVTTTAVGRSNPACESLILCQVMSEYSPLFQAFMDETWMEPLRSACSCEVS